MVGLMPRLGLGILVAVLLIVALGSCTFKIETTGVPAGKSARLGETIITMMSRLEPYVPTANRNPGNDRYTIGLLIHSARDTTARQFVPISTGQRASDIPLMSIIAVEGNLVWYRAPEVGAYDIARRKFLADMPATPLSLADLATGDRAILSMLIAGGHPTPRQWLGVLSETEVTSAWGPGTSIWSTFPVGAVPGASPVLHDQHRSGRGRTSHQATRASR